jgi:hypothetical protein
MFLEQSVIHGIHMLHLVKCLNRAPLKFVSNLMPLFCHLFDGCSICIVILSFTLFHFQIFGLKQLKGIAIYLSVTRDEA